MACIVVTDEAPEQETPPLPALQFPVPDRQVSMESGLAVSKYIACSMKGWRTEQEDAHIATALPMFGDAAVFGVFDGHGGQQVSKLASEMLVNVLEKARSQGQKAPRSLKEAFTVALPLLDKELLGGHKPLLHPFADQGSTACIAAVSGCEVTVANIGDSGALLIVDGKVHRLSEEHKPDTPSEQCRIERAGGFVMPNEGCSRVCGSLAVSRALGDFRHKANGALPSHAQCVTAHPDVTTMGLTGSACLLAVFCDGMTERLSVEELGWQIWQRYKSGKAMEVIGEEMMSLCCAPSGPNGEPLGRGQDNQSLVLVDLTPLAAAQKKGAIAASSLIAPAVAGVRVPMRPPASSWPAATLPRSSQLRTPSNVAISPVPFGQAVGRRSAVASQYGRPAFVQTSMSPAARAQALPMVAAYTEVPRLVPPQTARATWRGDPPPSFSPLPQAAYRVYPGSSAYGYPSYAGGCVYAQPFQCPGYRSQYLVQAASIPYQSQYQVHFGYRPPAQVMYPCYQLASNPGTLAYYCNVRPLIHG